MVERIFSINQASAREYDFNQPVVSVGSHPDNDIIIGGPGVLPFHATIVLESGHYRLIAMEPGAQINVDGIQVKGSQVDLETAQRVEIGNHALFFQQNGTSSSMRVMLYPLVGEGEPQQYALESDEKAILLNVLSDESEVDVDQTAVFEFEVINAGPIVASFFITLKGVPENWVEISPNLIKLNEGQRHLVQIRVTPPRDSSSEAGTHTLRAFVTSPNYASQRISTDLSLTIHPYYQFAVGNLSPKDQRISWRKKTGKAYLPITNQGNGTTDFNILALDDENGVSFDFRLDEARLLNRQANLPIAAAETVELPIEITPIKHPMFSMRSKRYHYTTNVSIPQNDVAPQVISGSATSVPLFGWWSIVLGVAALLLALFFILQPNIRSFTVAAGKDVIELGDTTRLDWDVSPFATRLSISNIEPPITRGQVSQTVAPVVSTTYELVSGNWLSGLVGLDQKRSVTVLVVPPAPLVNVFEVDKTSVSKGQSVNIRWSVSTADEVFLTIDEVVYPLTPEEYSGEQQVILEKDALITLEAKTGSGSELQSFFVNVVPPYININTFTVWVRPDAAASNPSSSPLAMTAGGKRFSMVNAPDPNFPVKFVELIPDVASDNGYRVYFNPDVRTELNKGEQVMLEWNVEGVDSLQIAPFTDQLPARGSQPFFPQESMNFVMTATSGDLTGIFMLPVKVFDGIPPTAPKIEFFRGTPLKMVGGGEVEFTWSISGEWTNVQLSNADGIIANNLNPVGFKKISIPSSQTIILTAFNGDLTSAMPLEIVVDPALKKIGIKIAEVYAQGGNTELMVGGEARVSIAFFKDPLNSSSDAPKPDPTGKILVSDGVSTCEINLPATSCALIFSTPGSPKQIKATYTGDAIYASATSDSNDDISVTSAKVKLEATYFRLNKADNTAGDPIGENLTTTQLSINDGLFIEVKVIPINTVLPDDGKSWITVKFCSSIGSGPILNTCESLLTVPVKIVSGQPGGIAYIPIASFPSAGLNALIIEYQHQQYVIDTTQLIQDGLNIRKLNILLSLSTCTSPDNLTGCSLGVTDVANGTVLFDLKSVLTNEKLSVLLPKPLASAFTVSHTDIPPTDTTPWTCQVVEEGTYKLKCTNIDFGSFDTKKVAFLFGSDPVYSLVPTSGSFDLTISKKTTINFNTTPFVGAKVGQAFTLTSSNVGTRIINIIDATTSNSVNATGQLKVTVNSTTVGMIGKTSDSTGCTLNGNVITIDSIASLCSIFFNHVGTNIPITVEYVGDANYAGSQTTVQVTINKQNLVTTLWQHAEGSATYQSWNKTAQSPNELLKIRTILDAVTQTPPFQPVSLVGRKLSVGITLNENANNGLCRLYNSTGGLIGSTPTTLSTTKFDVPISSASSNSVADFGLYCTAEGMDLSISLSFVAADQTDFAFDPATIANRNLFIANRGNLGMTINLKRVADSNPSIYTDSSIQKIKKLFVGESYQIIATVGIMWADYSIWKQAFPNSLADAQNHYLVPKVQLQLPSQLQDKIDVAASTCPYNSGTNTISVTMNQVIVAWQTDYGTYGYSDISVTNQSNPCTIKIITGTSFSDSSDIRFSYTATKVGYGGNYSVTKVFPLDGVDRQSVTLAFGSPVVSGSSSDTLSLPKLVNKTFTVSVTPEVANSSLVPLSGGGPFFGSSSMPAACYDVNPTEITFTEAKVSPTTSNLTVNFPKVCSGSLIVGYSGNDYFKTATRTINVNVTNPIATTTVVTASPPNTSLLGSSVTFTATVTPASGAIPTGNVEFFRSSGPADSLGTRTINGSGVATLTTSSLPAGSHQIIAVFTPSTLSNTGSTSSPVSYQVNKATSISLTANKSGIYYGENVTFSANLTSPSGTPSGSVEFFSNLSGSLGTDTLSGGIADVTVSSLTAGSHIITAVYTPTDNFAPATGTLSPNYPVTAAVTSTELILSVTETTFGQPVIFTANVTVTLGFGIPSGTVKFYENAVQLGTTQTLSNGTASITLSDLSVGTHNNIVAVYTGSTNYATSTSSPKQSVKIIAP